MWIVLVLFTVLWPLASPVHGGHKESSAGVKSVQTEGLVASYQPFTRVTANSSPDPTPQRRDPSYTAGSRPSSNT
jgi:hypothetical protein